MHTLFTFVQPFVASLIIVSNSGSKLHQQVVLSSQPTKPPQAQSLPQPKVTPKMASQLTDAPSPTPAQKPTVIVTPAHIEPMIQQYADSYRVDPLLLKKIMKCESGFNPNAVNGPYGGLYQFHSSTWMSTRKAMGQDQDPALRFNAEESIETAAFKIANGGIRAWPSCSKA